LTSFDNDIKIASDKPSLDIKKNQNTPKSDDTVRLGTYEQAKIWGRNVAAAFIKDSLENAVTDDFDFDMIIQRRLLLSFTATIGFEKFASDDFLCGVAQKSFLDTVKKERSELFETSQDTGAFSFYYLAFRRGGDVVRRIGQTFAMLCSHDGDPVYQELGEALYCWFLSVVKKAI
jgi:hypothetical protein